MLIRFIRSVMEKSYDIRSEIYKKQIIKQIIKK